MNEIIVSISFLSGLGFLFGSALCFASKKFYVEINEKEKKINEILPGANCGACGYSGCANYAAALAKDDNVPINLCTAGGEQVIKKIAEVLNKKAEKQEKLVAEILCKGKAKEKAKIKFEYKGINDCKFIHNQFNSYKLCNYGCLECGNCYRVCKFNAIEYDSKNPSIPKIKIENCVGCGACVKECPKKIIVLRPLLNHDVHIKCSNKDIGKIAKTLCDVACIGCGLCAKKCPVNAITIENNLAKIDYSKCVNCGKCVEVCPIKPEKVIIDYKTKRGKAEINDNCKGCSLCAKKCPVNAIEGKLKEKFKVDESKCIGCEICVQVCKFKAIDIK
ncbi:MAG TPA: RnfABCDGE type electron transport complex subunit B [bacterium]|nr:RnfABCDGE type electron transport complex subunit B [bacterium]HOL46908.1 RnfABCDGE type electron transport complex subunit B [bacterium]HPQ18330.1 RnfABCDGE type electron transport complex subunit B [bacterium]